MSVEGDTFGCNLSPSHPVSSSRGCRAIAEFRIILPATPNFKLILAAGLLAIDFQAFISP
jgi:hypothetical protein